MSTKPSQLVAQAKYYRAHQEIVKARHKAYRDANKAKLNAYQKAYRSRWTPEMKERARAYQKEYQKAYYRGYQVRPSQPRSERSPKAPNTFTKSEILEFKALLKPKPKAHLRPNIVQCISCEIHAVTGSETYFEGTTNRGAWLCFSCQPVRMEA